MDIQKTVDRAAQCFHDGFNCAESVLIAVTEHFGMASDMIPRAATPFGGGIARTQHLCGAVSGGVIAIGMLFGRDDPKGDRARSDALARDYIEWFDAQNNATECRPITGVDLSDPVVNKGFRLPGGPHDTICSPLVAKAVRYLCEKLENA